MLPRSTDLIECVQGATFSVENGLGGFGPDERLRPGIVVQQVVVDGGLQVSCRREMQLEPGCLDIQALTSDVLWVA